MNLIEHFRNARKKTRLAAGTVLFSEGEPGDVMYVLIDGMADVVVGDTPVELATPGSIVGEMALIDQAPRSASVVCRTACDFVSVDQAEFDLLVSETPEFARHVMGAVAERLRRMNERLRMAVSEIAIRQ